MKYIKRFERFSPAPGTAPSPAPRPEQPDVAPETPVKPERPTRPDAPGQPITTPSIDPGPMAGKKDAEDVISRLEMELKKRGESMSEFIKKNKKG